MPGRPEADLNVGGREGVEPPQGRRSDADDGDGGADAPTPNPPQLGPQAHPVQEKISRSGEPLTLIIWNISPGPEPRSIINILQISFQIFRKKLSWYLASGAWYMVHGTRY